MSPLLYTTHHCIIYSVQSLLQNIAQNENIFSHIRHISAKILRAQNFGQIFKFPILGASSVYGTYRPTKKENSVKFQTYSSTLTCTIYANNISLNNKLITTTFEILIRHINSYMASGSHSSTEHLTSRCFGWVELLDAIVKPRREPRGKEVERVINNRL